MSEHTPQEVSKELYDIINNVLVRLDLMNQVLITLVVICEPQAGQNVRSRILKDLQDFVARAETLESHGHLSDQRAYLKKNLDDLIASINRYYPERD